MSPVGIEPTTYQLSGDHSPLDGLPFQDLAAELDVLLGASGHQFAWDSALDEPLGFRRDVEAIDVCREAMLATTDADVVRASGVEALRQLRSFRARIETTPTSPAQTRG